MLGLLNNFRAFITGAVLLSMLILGTGVLYYKKEAEHLEKRLSLVSERNRDLTSQLKSLAEECRRNIQTVQESCSERLRIQKEELEKQIKACRELLDRRQRLEQKLDEIDRL